MSEFLSELLKAGSVPVTVPIEWSKLVDPTHPIRKVLSHIRLWDAAGHAALQKIIDEDDKANPKWVANSWWFIIAYSLSTKEGISPFLDTWKEIYASYKSVSPTDTIPPPSIDFHIVGAWLKSQFDLPGGCVLLDPIFPQAMNLNGYNFGKENQEAKN